MVTIDDIVAPAPVYDEVAARYRVFESDLRAAAGGAAAAKAVRNWDAQRRQTGTWSSLVNLRFSQDTANDQFKQAREYCDEITPRLTDLDVRMMRLLLAHPRRAGLEREFGAHAFALWETEVLSFDPAIESQLVQEAKLKAEYNQLIAGAKLNFRGATYNFSGFVKFREDADRQTRHEAEIVRWQWMADNRAQLDRIYDDLVHLRHAMARRLGFENHIGMGYKKMGRTDYTAADVAQFRAEVREHLVPLAAELRRRQAQALGVDALKFWDEAIYDPQGNPAPQGGHDWMVARATEMFDAMGEELGGFNRLMVAGRLTDLKNRDGKRFGGFCTGFPTHGVPFIFGNFNGTKHDVEVFTHEMGHAYQSYRSREKPLLDYFWPTAEAAEVHSMSLEMLTGPHMEKFFGPGAERFRRIHLTQALLFIPYGVAVDHFQHLVYARPDATPAERNAMWQEMERTYLPWREYDGMPHVTGGGMWQFQMHIYAYPFYYIDYTLAQTCALQFWVRAQRDLPGTMAAYHALCARGGEAPFQELIRSAGLTSPFQPGCLRGVVEQARKALAG